MKLRTFGASAFGALVSVSVLPEAFATPYNLVRQGGEVYCIGTTTGTYYYSGTNVGNGGANGDGFPDPPAGTRAEYSSSVPNNTFTLKNNNTHKGASDNKNHWSNEGSSVWGFEYYSNGSSNKVAQGISKNVSMGRLQFPAGIGGANRLRGFLGGIHQDHVSDTDVRAYTVPNVAYSVSLNLCGYGDSEEDYVDVPSIDLSKSWYTSKELLTGQVRPVFDGGTLLFDKNALYSDDNFIINNVAGNTIHNNDLNIELRGVLAGKGGLSFSGNGLTTLSGANSYIGDTNILSGIFKVTGSLSDVTAVFVNQGAVYKVASTDTVGSIEGAGDIQLFPDKVLTTGGNDLDTTFSGYLRGGGGLSKIGSGVLTISGSKNDYQGRTTISGGTIKLGSNGGIPKSSVTSIEAGATLDVNNQATLIDSVTLNGGAGIGTVQDIMANTALIRDGVLTGTITSNGGLLSGVSGADLNVDSGRTFIRDMKSGSSLGDVAVKGGQLWAASRDNQNNVQTVTVANLTLNTESFIPVDPRNSGRTLGPVQDGLVLGFDDDVSAALNVIDKFTYTNGNVYLFKPAPVSGKAEDYEGTWSVIDFKDGDLSDAEYEKLFSNTYVMYETPDRELKYFRFDGEGNPLDADLLREVKLKEGSLKIVVGKVDLERVAPDSSVSGGNPSGNDETIADEIEDEIVDKFVGGNDFNSDENQSGDSVASGGGSLAFQDDALADIGDSYELWTADELVEVVKRGLLPRNVDAAGQTLATYNNLLADTIFERTPMRQFTEVEPEVAVEPAPVVEPEVEPVPVGEPVRGLWSKSGELNDVDADAYLAEKTGGQPLVIADAQTTADHDAQHLIEINGKTYVENDSLTAEYADRDGVRGWFRGFGGQSADSNGESDTIYNPYGISAGGGIVGADVSLSESFQLGAYASYGDINLWQSSGVEGLGGGWNADGWGGGVTADYWTNNFYVQGLLGASGFSGEQKRSIKGYGVLFDDETASGEKSASTMVGALRIGAPFQSGSTYFEPQFTATWSGNSENRFSESADDERLGLTYKSRNTNYLQTALGMKFAWPMKTGETGLFTPSVKLAWLGDWNQGNEDQTIGFDFTDETYSVGSNQENVNGALIEAGLDYNVAKVEGTSVKAYVRGGAEVWGGNRGTQWRASGGMTFQF